MRRGLRALVLAVGLGGAAGAADLLLAPGVEATRLLGDTTARQRGVHPGFGLAGSVHEGLFVTSGPKVYEVRKGEWLDPGGAGRLVGLTLLGTELLATRGKELLGISPSGTEVLARLPEADMRMAASTLGDVVFLYGGRAAGRSVYGLMPNGVYEKVVEADQPITALGEAAGELVFATGYELYLFARFGKPQLLLRSAQPIVSIAVDPAKGTPFLATPAGVFVVTGAQPVPLVLGMTGALHHDGTNLIVADPVGRAVVALRPPRGGASSPKPLGMPGGQQLKFVK